MPHDVDGVQYFTTMEIADEIGVTRQTMYRWRRDGKIPQGHRFRDNRVVFTESEVESIRQFANHIEPITGDDPRQLKLFDR